jgi:hypothetical protein
MRLKSSVRTNKVTALQYNVLFSTVISSEEFRLYKYLRTGCHFIMLIRIIFISQIDFEEKPYKDFVYLKRGEELLVDGMNE